MSKYLGGGVVVAFFTLAASCIRYGEVNDPTVTALLEIANEAFSTAYVEGDMDALVDLYTSDARLMPPGRVVDGKSAIRAYFLNPGRRQIEHDMRTETLRVRGGMAVETGIWTNTYQDGDAEPVTVSDRYLLVWARQPDGSWKISLDMWHRPVTPQLTDES